MMSRLTGGIGGRGPGETKLEISRRRARERINLLEKKLANLAGDRRLRRQRRVGRGLPIIAVCGYTNAGKSTLLNALTDGSTRAENKLFATLDPVSRRLRFPDEREVIFTDTVGFIRDLPKDLRAAFAATLEEMADADLLVQVVDASDPDRDQHIAAVDGILAELALAEKVQAHLAAGNAARSLALTDDERAQVATWGLMTAKPVLYCCNVGEADLPNGNAWSDQVRARAEREGAGVVILCGKIEAELADLADEEKAELLASYGLKEPALATLAHECYRLLGLQSYFTAGEKEIRAWTIKKGALAPEAAGVIHTDFEKGFIRANVYTLADLEQHGSEVALKAVGKLRQEGKTYVVQDGDIMHFLFNV